MRKILAVALTLAMLTAWMPTGVSAAAPVRQGQTTGSVQAVAKDAAQRNLPGVRVQVRAMNGQIVATGTTDSTGSFSIAGLTPGLYVIEVVDDDDGNIVGTSAPVAVTAGATTTATVRAAAAGAIAAATGGGLSLFGLGPLRTMAVVGAAAAARILAIRSTQNDASPSR